jgi:ribosomal protein S6--L-glutamate ligase
MRIGILSRSNKLYSTRRLVESASALGHEVYVIDPLKCYMNISSNEREVHYREKVLNLDAIIPRIGSSVTFYGTATLRQFEMKGLYTINGSLAITRSRDKLRAHQILSRKGVGMPITGFAHSSIHTNDLINMVGGAPLVIKLLQGTQGKGVVLAETKKVAQSIIEAFQGLDAFFLVQEYIKEAGSSDIRCFVIGDKVVAAMKREGTDGDFRSNLHRGGRAVQIKITPKERKTAVDAAKAMGLKVAGVDIIRSNRGPLVLEVNSSPGLKGIEETTGLDIAKLIIKFLEIDIRKSKGRGNKG